LTTASAPDSARTTLCPSRRSARANSTCPGSPCPRIAHAFSGWRDTIRKRAPPATAHGPDAPDKTAPARDHHQSIAQNIAHRRFSQGIVQVQDGANRPRRNQGKGQKGRSKKLFSFAKKISFLR
jgi:hypothetical protein